MNFGSDIRPVWVWVKFHKHLTVNNKLYKYIYGIRYYDEYGGKEIMYYETDRDLKIKEINFKDYIIYSYMGDATLKLVNKIGESIYLFNVLELKDFRRKIYNKDFIRVPAVELYEGKKVSTYDFRLSFFKKDDNMYEVSIIDDYGDMHTYNYRFHCSLKKVLNEFEISYFDSTNNRIYLLEKDCYLEKI